MCMRSRGTAMNDAALALLRAEQQRKAVQPVVQRYELDRRIERMEQVLADLRVEYQRCRIASAGIDADYLPLLGHCTGIRGHLHHLQALRAAL